MTRKMTTNELPAAVWIALRKLPGYVNANTEEEMGETYLLATFDDGEEEISTRIIVECPEVTGPSRGLPIKKGTLTTFGALRVGQKFQVGPVIAYKHEPKTERAGDMYLDDTLNDMIEDGAPITPDTLIPFNANIIAPSWDSEWFDDDMEVQVL